MIWPGAPRWNPRGSIAIVTGASSGIGFCLCQRLLDRGAIVVATARRENRLQELERYAEGASDTPDASGDRMPSTARLIPVVGDITDADVRRELIQVASRCGDGRLDLLVNNAGIGAIGPFADAQPERLRRIMEVNFFAPVELTRVALELLRRGNHPVICNIASVLGHRAVPDKSEYCASKFAMHGWSDSLRSELAPQGIQVTLVSPSTTRSEFFDSLIDTSTGQASKSIGSWPADRVANAAIQAIIKRRSEVICSLAGKALVYGDRLSPPLLNAVLQKKSADS